MKWDELSDHIIICGWNKKAELIVRESQAAQRNRRRRYDPGWLSDARERAPRQPIVAIAQLDRPPTFANPGLKNCVQFLQEDFTTVSVLGKGGTKAIARVTATQAGDRVRIKPPIGAIALRILCERTASSTKSFKPSPVRSSSY